MSLYQTLLDLDFTILSERCENGYTYWMGDTGDTSVGVWPIELTPTFSSEQEIIDYLGTDKGREYVKSVLLECFDSDEVEERLK